MTIRHLITITFILLINSSLDAQLIRVPADEPTIQSGISAAEKGDTVLVSPGTYLENINFWGKNITVASLFLTTGDTANISQTIIDGHDTDDAVEISNGEDSTALLCGFTIRNGLTDANGGGINVYNASPRLENLKIHDCTAMYGGGVSCRSRSSTDPVAHPSLVNVIVINNTAQFGGGVYLEAGTSSMAGLLKSRLQNVLISGNNATRGAGILIAGLTETLIQNLTITGNYAEQSGGGISSQDYPLMIRNTIIWNNTPDEIHTTGNPTISFSDIKGGAAGENNIEENPKFAGTGSHPFILTGGSPCIDTGTPDTTGQGLPLRDIAGNLRIWDGDGDDFRTIDMGAYEFGSKPDGIPSPLTGKGALLTCHCFPNPSDGSTTFHYEVYQATVVTLEITDDAGRQVAVPVNTFQQTGKYTVHWDTWGLSPGVYYFRLTANGERQAANGKVVLVR